VPKRSAIAPANGWPMKQLLRRCVDAIEQLGDLLAADRVDN
jgi:hypothetical protein